MIFPSYKCITRAVESMFINPKSKDIRNNRWRTCNIVTISKQLRTDEISKGPPNVYSVSRFPIRKTAKYEDRFVSEMLKALDNTHQQSAYREVDGGATYIRRAINNHGLREGGKGGGGR
jgi:hypothetical protein